MEITVHILIPPVLLEIRQSICLLKVPLNIPGWWNSRTLPICYHLFLLCSHFVVLLAYTVALLMQLFVALDCKSYPFGFWAAKG
jgi:hypothetical protein